MSGKWPLPSGRLTMLEMVDRILMMQPLKTLVGMGSLSQVLFGAFSTSSLIRSDGIDSTLVKNVPASECSQMLLLIEWSDWFNEESVLSSFERMTSIFCKKNFPKSLASKVGSECLGYCSCNDPPSSSLAVLKNFFVIVSVNEVETIVTPRSFHNMILTIPCPREINPMWPSPALRHILSHLLHTLL